MGPNALGHVINLVTRQPQNELEADAFIGTGSGDLLNSGLHLGSRWRRFFFQASTDWLQSDFYPISGAFKLNAEQPTDHRVNSYQRDEQFRARIGWTPRNQDAYVLSYSNQKGNAGIPPYSGSAPVCPTGNATVPFPCVTPKYWSWPQWNADSYYFKQPSLGFAAQTTIVLSQFGQQVRAEHNIAIFASLAALNMDHHALAVDIADLEVGQFGPAHSCAVQRHQDGVMKRAGRSFDQAGDFVLAENDGQMKRSAA